MNQDYLRTFVIAEAGVNHNGSVDLAKQLIEAAAEAGADAVKFQIFTAEEVISTGALKAGYQSKTTGGGESQLEMVKKFELDPDMHKLLFEHCRKKNIKYLSTPFDHQSLYFLVEVLNVDMIKIPSGEITNAPFLLEIARTGKPVILSTGMSTLGEVEAALSMLAFGYINHEPIPDSAAVLQAYISNEGQRALLEKVTLLHCTTEYPAPFNDVNLRAMDTLKLAFKLPAGLSDHTMGIAVAIAAVAREACVIEKHLTLDRTLPGPDHQSSLEPGELKQMVESIRQVEEAMGSTVKKPVQSEINNIEIARKVLVAAKTIKKGDTFSKNNIAIKRCGKGLSPIFLYEMIGKKSEKDYQFDEPL